MASGNSVPNPGVNKPPEGGKVIMTVGPHGNVTKVDFTGVAAPYAAGGRTKNWMNVVKLEAKKAMAQYRANQVKKADELKREAAIKEPEEKVVTKPSNKTKPE